jgi:endonuclease/exonuclease/phosphatase family metal-dependent hydrolase
MMLSTIVAALTGIFSSPFSLPPKAEDRISVLSFNVENLFDLKDDPIKSDETYLPSSQKGSPRHLRRCHQIRIKKWREDCLHLDWSEGLLREKLKRISQVILAAGGGPDLVLLQEVENLSILRRLESEFLSQAGYHAVLIEGADERGIDVALLSRWPLAATPKLHAIPFGLDSSRSEAATRGLLEVQINSPFGPIRVFVLHLPSAFHPARMRERALGELERLTSGPTRELVLVGGDFNVSAREELRRGRILRAHSTRWRVSHLEGCSACLGTVFHKGWSFFDQIWMLRRSESLGWRLVPESIRVIRELDFQRSSQGPGPLRFRKGFLGLIEGISDHWPLYVEIEAPRQLTGVLR